MVINRSECVSGTSYSLNRPGVALVSQWGFSLKDNKTGKYSFHRFLKNKFPSRTLTEVEIDIWKISFEVESNMN